MKKEGPGCHTRLSNPGTGGDLLMYGLHQQCLLCLAKSERIFAGGMLQCIHHLQPVAYYKAILTLPPTSPALATLQPGKDTLYYRTVAYRLPLNMLSYLMKIAISICEYFSDLSLTHTLCCLKDTGC